MTCAVHLIDSALLGPSAVALHRLGSSLQAFASSVVACLLWELTEHGRPLGFLQLEHKLVQ